MSTVQARLMPLTFRNLNTHSAGAGSRLVVAERKKSSPLDRPSSVQFIVLLSAFRASGGMVQGSTVSRLIADHCLGRIQSLAHLVYSGQVFGLTWRGSLWIPMFQFEPADLSLRFAAQETRKSLPSLWSGWQLAHWFTDPHGSLDMRAPVDCLAVDLPAVIAAATRAR